MRRVWLSLKWRMMAALYIAWWFAKGAPMENMPFGHRRRDIVKGAWEHWRAVTMLPLERDQYVTADEWLESLKQ